jgi:hypothetical protein
VLDTLWNWYDFPVQHLSWMQNLAQYSTQNIPRLWCVVHTQSLIITLISIDICLWKFSPAYYTVYMISCCISNAWIQQKIPHPTSRGSLDSLIWRITIIWMLHAWPGISDYIIVVQYQGRNATEIALCRHPLKTDKVSGATWHIWICIHVYQPCRISTLTPVIFGWKLSSMIDCTTKRWS